MTPMSARLDDLRQRLAALRTRFAEVAARAAAAAAAMRAGAVPAEALLDDLRGTAADFDELRLAILDEASALPRAPDPTRLGTLKALDALVSTIGGAETDRARRAAWEAARDDALSALDRVMTLVHREDTSFPPLAECQAKARELHAALSAAQPSDLERITTMLSGGIRPFAELVALAEGWNRLDDERCALLQDSISQNFGRPLALATVRGKLGREGEIISTPAAAVVPAPPVMPTARAAPVGDTPVAGDVPVPGGAPVGGGMRAPAGAHTTADRSATGDGNVTGHRRVPDGCGAGRGHDEWRGHDCGRGRADDLALAAQLPAHRCEGEWAAKILADRVLQQRAAFVVEPVPPLGERDELGERTDASAQHRRDALEVGGLRRRQGGVQLARLGLALGQRGEARVLAVDERHDAVERAQRVIACRLPRRPPRAIGLRPTDRADERIEGLQRAEPGGIGRPRQRARLVEDGQAQLVEVGGRAPQVVEQRLGGDRAGSHGGGGRRRARRDLRESGTQSRKSLPQIIETSAHRRHVSGRSSIADGPVTTAWPFA